MSRAEKRGITLSNLALQATVLPQNKPVCDTSVAAYEEESTEYAQLCVEDIIVPIIFFSVCAVTAVLMQLWHERTKGSASRPLLGRTSAFQSVGKFAAHLSIKKMFEKEGIDIDATPAGDGTLGHGGSPVDEEDRRESWMEQHPRGEELRERKSVQRTRVSFEGDGMNEGDVAQANPLNAYEKGSGLSEGRIHDSSNEKTVGTKSTSSRIEHLVETGALDDLLDCLQDIKRRKEV